MNIIGIDPGKSGAIAIWNGGIDRIVKCPLNVIKMADEVRKIKDKRNTIAYVERVHAFPTDARSSAFKFGMNYGEWLGILGAMRIKTVLVPPQTWMKYFKDKLKIKLPKEKPKRKRKLKELASQYTDKSVTLYNSDAILISVYGFIQETKRKEK